MRPASFLLLFACLVVLGSAPVDAADPDPSAAPARLDIERSSGRLTLRGDISSAAHEAILRDSARRFFAAEPDVVELQLSNPPRTPPGWALVTDMVLRTLANTRSATATVTPEAIHIRGVAHAGADLTPALRGVEKAMFPNMQLINDIIRVDDTETFDALCRRRLGTLLNNRPIRFQRATDSLRISAYPALDAIVEVMAHCADLRIRIAGAGSPNDSTDRQQLSRQRAAAVAKYLAEGGVPEHKLALEPGSQVRKSNSSSDVTIDVLPAEVRAEPADGGRP